MDDKTTSGTKPRTIVETIEVTGTQVIDQVKRLIAEGNVNKMRITDKDGDFSLEMPMTISVLVGGAVVLSAPWLAILGVIAGLVTKVKIEVERDSPVVVAEAPKTEAPEAEPLKTGPQEGAGDANQ